MKRFLAVAVALLLVVVVAAPSLATPEFPPLTGRVVDNADILPPATEKALTDKLAQLEASTHHQLVVATFPNLQGYEIEDFGYQLGRRWGIGGKENDDGVLFIIAPKERKVRIEVGYGLEPVLTDALSSTILQTQVLPKFKAGDMPGGVVAGTDAIINQLAAPADQAMAVAAKAAEKRSSHASPWPFIPIFPILFFLFVFFVLGRIGRRRRRGGLGGVLPWLILSSLNNRGGGGWSGGGGGWSGGGGGFSGGGGSFGGGGSSGGW